MDIVERLRGTPSIITALEAAAEIERLRNLLQNGSPVVEGTIQHMAMEIMNLKKERDELVADRNAFLAKELEAVATWSADGIYRYIQQLTDEQFCAKCVRGQCTGNQEGVCCGN